MFGYQYTILDWTKEWVSDFTFDWSSIENIIYGTGLPKEGLLLYIKDGMTDSVGMSNGPVQPGRGYIGDGISHILIDGLLTTDVIAADSTSLPTCVIDGRLDVSSGLIVHGITVTRGGETVAYYPCAESLGPISINTFQGAGTLGHGAISDDSVHTEIIDGTGYDLNQLGFTVADGNQYLTDDGLNKVITGTLIPPGITYSYNVDEGVRIVLMGDSITATSMDELTSDSFEADNTRDWAYFSWCNVFMGQKFEVLRNLAVGGTNTEYTLLNVPYAIAYNPDYAVVMVGANDLIGTPTETLIARQLAIYDQLREAGITVVAIPIIPNSNITDSVTLDKYDGSKAAILDYCNTHDKAIYADVGMSLLDTGASYPVLRAEVTEDGVHPNVTGAIIMGQSLATILSQEPGWTRLFDPMSIDNLIINGALGGTSGDLWGNCTGEVADGWICNDSGSYGDYTSAVASKIEKDGKIWQQLDVTGGNTVGDISIIASINGYSTNDKIRAFLEFEVEGFTSSNSEQRIELYLRATGGIATTAYTMKHNTPNAWDGSITTLSGTLQTSILNVPAGTTDIKLYMHILSPSVTLRVTSAYAKKVGNIQ